MKERETGSEVCGLYHENEQLFTIKILELEWVLSLFEEETPRLKINKIMTYTVEMLINDYQLRLEQTQNLYNTIQEEELREVILIQLNIYNTILADLEQLQIK